jgi:hypothetical protein
VPFPLHLLRSDWRHSSRLCAPWCREFERRLGIAYLSALLPIAIQPTHCHYPVNASAVMITNPLHALKHLRQRHCEPVSRSEENVTVKIQVFWDITMCRLVNSYPRLGGICFLSLQGFCSSLTLQMEATHPYEKSVTTFKATWRHNLEAVNLHQHCCENLGSRKLGNVETTKGINKGRTEETCGREWGTYSAHHPV